MIGGSSLLGGEGTVTGTLIGALIMGVLRNGLNLLNVSSFLQQVVIGVVIIGAVLVDMTLKRRRRYGAARFTLGTANVHEPTALGFVFFCGLCLVFVCMAPSGLVHAGPQVNGLTCYERDNRMQRVTQLAVVAVAVLMLAAACNRGGSTGTGGAPRVAFVMKTLNHPFFLDMQRGAQEAAGPAGVNLVVQAAERGIDIEKQVQIIENLLQTGIQALIVTPSRSARSRPRLRRRTARTSRSSWSTPGSIRRRRPTTT